MHILILLHGDQCNSFCSSFIMLLYYFKVPTMKLLNQIVIPRIAEDWKLIAGYLEYKVEFIQLIKKDESTGDKDCCVALFEDWLTTDNGTSPKTWSTLIRGLREIKKFKSNTEKIIQDLAKAGVPV